MNLHLFKKLHQEELIADSSLEKIKAASANALFSVHGELTILLYLGVLLLSGGLGILIYKNIDTIGHQVILLAIALLCAGCFYYCVRNKLPFSTQRVPAPNAFFDYILLLGCLTFITFITYLQVQYHVFGTRYGTVTFVPLLVLFFSAYYFDHLGILSMAIVNLAAWMGIVTTPTRLLTDNDFSDTRLIYTGLLLGALLLATAFAAKTKNVKPHFAFTYANFGTHLLLISCLAALFAFEQWYLLWFLVLAGIVAVLYRLAIRNRSFYFMLIIVLYAYIGLSYVFIRLLTNLDSANPLGALYLGLFYFIGTGIGLVMLLVKLNKRMNNHDSL